MSKDKKIAINIALLLPKEIHDLCLNINEMADQSQYVTFKDGHQPHITLAQSCILESEVEELKNKLDELLRAQKPLLLKIIDFSKETDPRGFSIEKGPKILTLHSEVMNLLQNFSRNKMDKACFYEPEQALISESFMNHVDNFVEKHSGSNYKPHISLGKEIDYKLPEPIEFTSSMVGLFQPGRSGTCKNKLAEFKLK